MRCSVDPPELEYIGEVCRESVWMGRPLSMGRFAVKVWLPSPLPSGCLAVIPVHVGFES